MKREAILLLQYFVLALVAGVVSFVVFIPAHANIHEAWLNYEPYLGSWLLIFGALGGIRLLVFYIINCKKQARLK